MTTKSQIEWTEHTWNPVIGCTKVSPGCKNCYAEVMAKRLKAMKVPAYKDGFKLRLMPERLMEPLKRQKPTTYFVNSMSDLFHEDVPFEFVDHVMTTITITPQHRYQILTKRAERMREYFAQYGAAPNNAWLGVSVEDKKYGVPRIAVLREIETRVRFLSVEPLLEDLGEVDFSNMHWVIAGGESGRKARPVKREWILNIKDNCERQGVAFFFKQWGAFGDDGVKRSKKANGRQLAGRTWDAMPAMA